jgi:hypothetical protein
MDEWEVAGNAIPTINRLASEEYVKLVVGHSIETLLWKDGVLLANGVGERCICHKLAEILGLCFPVFGVDCEYNRVHHRVKEHEYKGEQKKVTPDIIVHLRVTSLNLLVIEAKVTSNTNKQERSDAERLEYFTGNPDFKYQFGLSLTFETRKDQLDKATHLEVEGQWFKANKKDGKAVIWNAPMDNVLKKCVKERIDLKDDDQQVSV